MIIAMETATTHEARARNAKAQALAEILHEASASPADLATEPFALGSAAWARAAAEATRRHLMGTKPNGDPVKVNVPHSRATIDAVARILGDLIAHENDQAAIAEQVAPQPADDRAERPVHFQSDASHVTCGALMRSRNCPDGWDLGTITLDWLKVTCEGCYAARPIGVERTARDSQGYRSAVGQLDPETARTFAAFAQADRR